MYVTDQTELKTVLIVTELNLKLYSGTLLQLMLKNYLLNQTEPKQSVLGLTAISDVV